MQTYKTFGTSMPLKYDDVSSPTTIYLNYDIKIIEKQSQEGQEEPITVVEYEYMTDNYPREEWWGLTKEERISRCEERGIDYVEPEEPEESEELEELDELEDLEDLEEPDDISELVWDEPDLDEEEPVNE